MLIILLAAKELLEGAELSRDFFRRLALMVLPAAAAGVLDEAVIHSVSAENEVPAMPKFPSEGYCGMVGDYLVINF